jgi:hypothetical protein
MNKFLFFLILVSCGNSKNTSDIYYTAYRSIFLDGTRSTSYQKIESKAWYEHDTLFIEVKNKFKKLPILVKDSNTSDPIYIFSVKNPLIDTSFYLLGCTDIQTYKTMVQKTEHDFDKLETLYMVMLINKPRDPDAIKLFESSHFRYGVFRYLYKFNYSYLVISDRRGVLNYTEINNLPWPCIYY